MPSCIACSTRRLLPPLPPPANGDFVSHSLIVLPDDTAQPILDANNGARQELLIRMFVFLDPTFVEAVAAAARRGASVRVVLNEARRDGRNQNEPTRKALQAAGVEVREGNPAFDLTHEKSMVVDRALGIVQS